MTVKHKVMEAQEIRAELGRRKMSRKQLSDETGISYQYLVEIVNGYYPAHKMRERITRHLFPEAGLELNAEFHRDLGIGGGRELRVESGAWKAGGAK